MVQRAAIYARVSTSDQSCDRQIAELTDYVIELARKRQIDLVLVSELSRWGRSTPDLRSTIEDLAKRGVALRALNGPDFDITTAQGKLMLNLLASISEFERDLLRERIKSGIAHARSKGTKTGRAIGRPAFDRSDVVKSLLAKGNSVRAVAAEFGISKTTVMKVKAASRLGESSRTLQ